jgi:hypothetical protein
VSAGFLINRKRFELLNAKPALTLGLLTLVVAILKCSGESKILMPNLNYDLALYFAYHNFCRIHKTIRYTPAMEAGITKTIWELKDLLKFNGE